MPQYKLIYFDFRGRGELSRFLFALAGQEYEDVRIKYDDFPGIKDKYVFGRLPVLEVDGKQYGQSMAITSFLARRFGFHGNTDVEVLEVDQVLGIVSDLREALVRFFMEKDEARKVEIAKENSETNMPRYLGFLETVLKNSNTGFYVGNKLGYADVAAFDLLDSGGFDQGLVERFPLVKANAEKVKANPGIAKWLAKRPQLTPSHQKRRANNRRPSYIMPTYKLKYFDSKGRAEVCRLLFAMAGQKYEDVRYSQDEWLAEKNNTPFGQLPVLEVDGQQYAQSFGIIAYLAREFGLHGKDNLEQLKVDQVMGIIQDIYTHMLKHFMEKDKARQAEILKENNTVHYPKFLGFFESILKKNGTGFFVGDRITLADIAVFDTLDGKIDASVVDSFPLVKENGKKVRTSEKIAQWLDKRPKTAYYQGHCVIRVTHFGIRYRTPLATHIAGVLTAQAASNMPSYKLIYSQHKGRAELSRLLFALAGQKYEDVRWTRETLQAEKQNLLFGQIPVLEVDGKQYAQSMAIAGFLAREFGFHGKTSIEQMEVDQVIGIVQDIFSALIKQYLEQDEEKKAAFTKENNETTFPKFVGFFEKILKNNNTGFYVGDKLGLADLAAYDTLSKIDGVNLDAFPLVKANKEKVESNERIAKWLQERPVTEL
ncbi:uncharacterized protein [Haliotis asinina]|uniref:uncharacterized protein n=1 Tax=Haliotis asinina TaxID=109174 RepID=UPI0035326B46